ncbi:MAG: RNA 2',3'-cyclic phosphodiesterase [Gammaproteobacteria bacterium]|nr:RNA 2',3'-cyclic phosphodiesterase [Gammaproteobacteria bacterium]
MKTEPRRRLFFALWPDDGVRADLAQAATYLLGKRIKRVPAANLHLTLAFAGAVTAPVRDCLEAAAGNIHCPAFELCIDYVGHWSRPRIFWMGPTHTPPALWSLAGLLQTALEDCGLQPETRPYQPHITLARKISTANVIQHGTTQINPVHWSIRRFCLLESVTGPRAASYHCVASWVLGC